MHKTPKSRVDTLLVERGLVSSRHRARALIMAGRVRVDGAKIEKPGKEVALEAVLTVEEDLPYVSRGGLKLEAALDTFEIDPAGLRVLDAGASTGGFTDCLLQRGAARVVAVDVGYGQFHWKLRSDPRVSLLERTNLRFLGPEALPHPVDAAVGDLSFISLKVVLPIFREILPGRGWLVVLVKPQFEVGRADVGKGGVVRDPARARQAVEDIQSSADLSGFDVLGDMESPLKGPKGNREFFLYLIRR